MSATKAAKAARQRTVASKGGRKVKESEQAPLTKTVKQKIARSSKTGKLVTEQFASANPETTEVEIVERTLKKKFKIPASFGKVADLLYTTRQERLRLAKVVEMLEQQEKELKNHVINNLSKGDSGAAGRIARVQVIVEPQPTVEDWDEFYKHIKKKGEFDLLNRAPNRKAIAERWNNGKEVPGVGKFDAVKVSVTKV